MDLREMRHQVDDGFDICWQCGTSKEGVEDPTFTLADQTEPIEDRLYDPVGDADAGALGITAEGQAIGGDVVEAYQAFSLVEAKFIADQLVGGGIPAMSDTQDMQDALGVMDGNPRVYVRAEDLPRAHAWLAEYEQKRKSDMGRHLDHE